MRAGERERRYGVKKTKQTSIDTKKKKKKKQKAPSFGMIVLRLYIYSFSE